ncbi:MAG: hypothetical protein V4482_00260 [Pseudomonadota bacterium]
MPSIDPSHFAALSFVIFIAFLVWKRFFNLGTLLDVEIDTIKTRISDAAQEREISYARLKEMSIKLENNAAKVLEIAEKGRLSCDVLLQSMREEIAVEIAKRQQLHAMQARQLEEHFRKLYQEQLIKHISEKLTLYLHEHANDAFQELQLEKALNLLSPLKIAA